MLEQWQKYYNMKIIKMRFEYEQKEWIEFVCAAFPVKIIDLLACYCAQQHYHYVLCCLPATAPNKKNVIKENFYCLRQIK
jgi:hypothetical protein